VGYRGANTEGMMLGTDNGHCDDVGDLEPKLKDRMKLVKTDLFSIFLCFSYIWFELVEFIIPWKLNIL
jgi:hypothetical protein